MRAKYLTLVPLACMLGCSMAPVYRRPEIQIKSGWKGSPPSTEKASELGMTSYFKDPNLQTLLQLALSNNRDVRIAALQVQRAQAAYRIQRSALFPNAGIQANGSRTRLPERMNGGESRITETNTVQVGIISWELDLFGRVSSLKNRALNQYLATEQAKVAAQISLVAAVAQGYYTYGATSDSLKLAESTLESLSAYYRIVADRRTNGLASDLDLSQAEGQVEAARMDVARLRGRLEVNQNALEELVGQSFPPELLPTSLKDVDALSDVPSGLPSTVLLNRPDIQSSEFNLMAAQANIGAARAAFFPNISLTGGVGTMSSDVSGLFGSGARTWSFAPQISLPLFAGGALRANLKTSQVERDLRVAEYEKSIQTAFREVADGLALRSALASELESQRAFVSATKRTWELSLKRYELGLDNYMGVLIFQRSLYASQQALLSTRLAKELNQITLYKALAGGLR